MTPPMAGTGGLVLGEDGPLLALSGADLEALWPLVTAGARALKERGRIAAVENAMPVIRNSWWRWRSVRASVTLPVATSRAANAHRLHRFAPPVQQQPAYVGGALVPLIAAGQRREHLRRELLQPPTHGG